MMETSPIMGTINMQFTRIFTVHHERVLWFAGCLLSFLIGAGIMNGIATYGAVQAAWHQCFSVRHQNMLKSEGFQSQQ